MSGGWLRRTGFLLSALVLLGVAAAAPARAEGPGPDFKLRTDADEIFTSPDGQIRVEQYYKDMGDAGYLHQFWTFDDKHQNASLLNRRRNHRSRGLSRGLSLQREQPVAGADAENRRGFSRPVSVPAERICILVRHAKIAERDGLGLLLGLASIQKAASQPQGPGSNSVTSLPPWSKGWTTITPGSASTGPIAVTS